jgi:hypothetical protein
MSRPNESSFHAGSDRIARWSAALLAAFIGCSLQGTGGGVFGPPPANPKVAPPFELSPGAVIDPAEGTAYVMSEKGGIDAVDLARGEGRWHSNDGDRPIALAGDRLLTMAAQSTAESVLGLVELDVHSEGRKVREWTVKLPAGVFASVDDRLTSEFRIGAVAAGRDIVVSWSFTARPERAIGSFRETSVDEAVREAPVVRGAFRVDPTSREVADATPNPDLPAALAVRPLHDSDRRANRMGTQYLSADGSHLLVVERASPDAPFDKYVWIVAERDSDKDVGRLRTHSAGAPFFVRDGAIIHLTRPFGRSVAGNLVEDGVRLRSADLRTGEERWSWPIRDTRYRGRIPN